MIFTEKQVRKIVTEELLTLQIHLLEEETTHSIVNKLKPYINGFVHDEYFVNMIADAISLNTSEQVKRLVSSKVDTELFIDDIVSRIKKKQL